MAIKSVNSAAPTEGSDTIFGTPGRDVIDALGGNDTVFARGGNDVVRGGAGDDALFGQGGGDLLIGDTGDDRMFGGLGGDRMVWNNGDGSDLMEGGAGWDTAEVNGSDSSGDEFTIAANGARVDFDRVNFGQFSLDIGTTERLEVNSGYPARPNPRYRDLLCLDNAQRFARGEYRTDVLYLLPPGATAPADLDCRPAFAELTACRFTRY